MNMFGSWRELVRIVFRKSSRQVTLEPSAQTVGDPTVNIPDMAGTTQDMVLRTQTQTLTNKTLTAPVINSPTGIVKADVGLGNVDNTSDATKNAASVTLTNKKLDDSTTTVTDTSDPTKIIAFDAGGTTGTKTTITGAQTANRVVTLPDATTTLLGTDNTATVTNKTINGADHDFSEYNTQGSDPASPAGAGDVRVYAKDKFLYTKDSDGTVTQVGAGSGGRNYLAQDFFGNSVGTVGSGNVTDTGNRSTGTMTAWQTTNSANISISSSAITPLRETGSFLTTGSGNAAAGTTFIESKGFNLDNVDLGKPISVLFDISGSTLSTDWDVCVVRYNSSGTFQEKIAIAGTASTGTPASALLPTGTTTFRGFFIPSSTQTDYYAIRWRRLANAVNIRFDSLQVSPFGYQVGFAGSDWMSWTPTSTWTSNVTHTGYFRRVGDTLDLTVRIALSGAPTAATLDINLPTGYTIDTAKIPSTATNGSNIMPNGKVRLWDNSAGAAYLCELEYRTTTSVRLVYYGAVGSTLQNQNIINATTPFTWATSDSVEMALSVPITSWGGSSNVQLADRAVEEYAFNTSTNDAADTTSFGNGPAGNSTPGALTATRKKRIRFLTPIQPTDTLYIEFQETSTSPWAPIGQFAQSGVDAIVPFQTQVATNYGVGISQVSSTNNTDLDVLFGRYVQPNGATYGAAGQAWPLTNFRWRVRKVSGGALVGYPISYANIYDLANGQVRADTGNGFGSTNTKIRRLTNFVTIGTAITGADSATLGTSFTINEKGIYSISYSDASSVDSSVGISLNSAALTTNIESQTAAVRLIRMSAVSTIGNIACSVTVRLAVGDVIRPHADGSTNSTSNSVQFIITQVCRLP